MEATQHSTSQSMDEGHPLRSASDVPVMETPAKSDGVMSVAETTAGLSVTNNGDLGERPSASLDNLPPNTKPEAKSTGRQTNQLQFIHRILTKQVWKHKYCWPFTSPVDPIKLNIPDYFDIVKNPMDLGTIRKRLEKHEYRCAADTLADIKQVFNNCRLYNRPDSDVHNMGNSVEEFFNTKLKGMPALEEEVVPASVLRQRKQQQQAEERKRKKELAERAAQKAAAAAAAAAPVAAPVNAPVVAQPAQLAGIGATTLRSPPAAGVGLIPPPAAAMVTGMATTASAPKPVVSRSTADLSVAKLTSHAHTGQVMAIEEPLLSVPQLQQQQQQVAAPLFNVMQGYPPVAQAPKKTKKLVKRQADTTTPGGKGNRLATAHRRGSTRTVRKPVRDLPDTPPRKVKLTERMRACQQLVKELQCKKHSDYNWPFLQPVDWVTMKLHDYLTIIKTPMDLGSVKDKFAHYQTPDELLYDMRLIFSNCYHYNPPDCDVVVMAKKLEVAFEQLVVSLPPEVESESSQSDSDSDAGNSSGSGQEDSDSSAESEGIDEVDRTKKLSYLQDQLRLVTNELNQLTESSRPKATKRKHKHSSMMTSSTSSSSAVASSGIAASGGKKRKVEEKAKELEQAVQPPAKKKKSSKASSSAHSSAVSHASSTPASRPALPAAVPSSKTVAAHSHAASSSSKSKAKKKTKSAKESSSTSKPAASSLPPAQPAPAASKRSKVTAPSFSEDDDEDEGPLMTYEQKRDLSLNINKLPGDKLTGVVSIIQQREAAYKRVKLDEVEIDFGTLRNSTLQALATYVNAAIRKKKPLTQKKKVTGESRQAGLARQKKELEERLSDVSSRLADSNPKKKTAGTPAAGTPGSGQKGMLGGAHGINPMLAQLPERALLSDSGSSSSDSDSDGSDGSSSSSGSSSGSSSSGSSSSSDSDSDSDAPTSKMSKSGGRPLAVPKQSAHANYPSTGGASTSGYHSNAASKPASLTGGSRGNSKSTSPAEAMLFSRMRPSAAAKSIAGAPVRSAPGSASSSQKGYSRPSSPALSAPGTVASLRSSSPSGSPATLAARHAHGRTSPTAAAKKEPDVKKPASEIRWAMGSATCASSTRTTNSNSTTSSALSRSTFEDVKRLKEENEEKERRRIKDAKEKARQEEEKKRAEELRRKVESESSAMQLLAQQEQTQRNEMERRRRLREEAAKARQQAEVQVNLTEQMDLLESFEASM